MDELFSSLDSLRQEIAQTAARLIAQDGYTYESARQKALRMKGSSRRPGRDLIPSDQEIEQAVRAYQALFQSDTQPGELLKLRQEALQIMSWLVDFEPILYGPAVNGTGSRHSDIHVLAFSDDPKEIDFFLINADIDFQPVEDALLAGKSYPALGFRAQTHWVQLGTAQARDRRGLLRKSEKETVPFQTDLNGLKLLLEQH